MKGGKSGPPDIQEVTIGSDYVEGRYGSKLGYAEYVIGYDTQAAIHRGRWWTNNALAIKATKKVVAIFERMASIWADWMN